MSCASPSVTCSPVTNQPYHCHDVPSLNSTMVVCGSRACAQRDATLLRRRPTGETEWWTFAGLRANVELAARLGPLSRSVAGIDDLSIALADDADKDDLLAALDRETPVGDLLDIADEVAAGIKFADCIPDWLADAVVLASLSDADAVKRVIELRIDEAWVT